MNDLITIELYRLLFLLINLRKNDEHRMLQVRVVYEELVQYRQFYVESDWLHPLFDNVNLMIFYFEIEFFCEIKRISTKLPGSQKMIIASRIISTMQSNFWSRSLCCYDVLAFIVKENWQYGKLRSTSSLVWSLANGQQSRLKDLSNDRFFLIPLNEKKRGDGHSIKRSRGAKVGGTSLEDTFFIVWSHWLNLYFSRISVGICEDNYIRKAKMTQAGRT